MIFSKPNDTFRKLARDLRKNSTLSEVLLWNRIKNKQFMGLDFDRQKVVDNKYIVDFYCERYELVIEIDGSSHENKAEYDLERHEYLTKLGFVVVHVSDEDVKGDIEAVLEYLKQFMKRR
jgi:very-short-patch-repair endonuclease